MSATTSVNYSDGATRTVTSTLAHRPNAVAFNQVTTRLSATGTFSIWNSTGTADLVIDVMGSYGPLATYTYNGNGLRASRTTTTAGCGGQTFALGRATCLRSETLTTGRGWLTGRGCVPMNS